MSSFFRKEPADFTLEARVSQRNSEKFALWGPTLVGWWNINGLEFGKYSVAAVYQVGQKAEAFDVKALQVYQRSSLYMGPLESPPVECWIKPK